MLFHVLAKPDQKNQPDAESQAAACPKAEDLTTGELAAARVHGPETPTA